MRLSIALSVLVFAAFVQTADAQQYSADDTIKRPPTFEQLSSVPKGSKSKDKKEGDPAIRDQGLKEAALSYGARGGLALRTWEIRQTLAEKEAYLDRIYDFKRLLITAPSGLMIEPPIISEGEDAMLIENGGQSAAVADRIYNINVDAQIVAAPRNWRAYLERDWGDVTPPPSVLYPETEEERKIFLDNLRLGWEQGTTQANEIFQADLDRLNADFNGMVRYRMLLAQGIVTAPFTLQTDRGITGGGKEMRVGDRALQITGPSQLQTGGQAPGGQTWQPASR